MAKPDSQNFNAPPEMRAFAEKSVEQAKQAFETFVSAAQSAANTMTSQAATVQSGAREIGDLAMQFAERNMTSSFELAEKLVRAKDVDEVVALHGAFVKRQMEALTEQARKLSDQAAKMSGVKTPR